MKTEKLYYKDCHLSQFSAFVTACQRVEGGYEILLDATAFYPEGGGQPCDLGKLGDARVLDVQERGEAVIHLCDRPLPVGEQVSGKIDMLRRFDLMQQHSGEHILSGIICRRWGYHNVGFHIGSDMVTIDFDGIVPMEALEELEAAANQAIWENLPIRCYYPNEEELPTIPYRSKKALRYPVRIVEIGDVDTCACCGVHVDKTGEIGLLKIFSCVKFHQGVRMEIACGRWAFNHLNAAFHQNRQVSQAFSAKITQTGEAAREMNARVTQLEYRCTGLQKRIFATIAQSYRGQGDVLHFEADLTPTALRELADAISETCGGTAAVYSGNDTQGYAICIVDKQKDMTPLSTALRQELNAKGGGRGFFQGKTEATQTQITAFFVKLFGKG